MSRIDFETEEAGSGLPVKHTGRANGFALFVLVAATLGVLAWIWSSSQKSANPVKEEKPETFNTAQARNVNWDFHEPPPKKDNRMVIEPPPVVAAPPPPPAPAAVAVLQPAPVLDDSEARRLAEEEKRRREEEARRLAALRSGMLIFDGGSQGEGSLAGGSERGGALRVDGPETDSNRAFMARASSQDVETARATKNNRIDALIPQGTMIRGTLETAIQSDLPGMVRAITSEDVYSFDGRRVLIPKGTMLTGEYKSGLSRGQTRVLVAWTRMLRADGVSVSPGSYGTDGLGRSGLAGDVDNHYPERFGSAILLSVVGGVSSFIAGLNSDGQSAVAGGGSYIQQQAQTQAQQTIAQTMSDLANQALKDSINIPPTIHVDQGTRIMVFVRRDLDFSGLYQDPVKEALNELRRSKAVYK
ncbi:type IV secretion system protein VirB10 [Microvirga lotononidis]|uniref:Type IV secretory pathway, VirB10 component n=1 Tax=Microvirga lotononidis TaxID=864069 RepID=I4YRC3_9HYPH|nr:type IV secretion system protein VirB10 [Microvirga lotononidis]EIM26515.1 type IV secretory pathway, VirB10 component [Microvirga lotononidis]WQO31199.1 type IV secretion system protein VirB10 [Microvirga lotononidis]